MCSLIRPNQKFILFMLAQAILTGCLPTYLVRSGYDQMKLLSQREPIEDVLKKKDLTPEHRQKLELTMKVRDFAKNELGLKDTDSYKTFVDIQRPHVTYIVLAAKKWELEQYLFWFPLVGKLPYKGYFQKKDAEDEAEDFDKEKYDVIVRGVTAYSTLGWFKDPILSTMLRGEDHDLVNLLIHESTHATLYFKSQADFNEQLATFIGNKATEIYYKKLDGENSVTLQKIEKENYDEKLFSEFITKELEALKMLYKQKELKTEDARKKHFTSIQSQFETLIKPKMQTNLYQYFAKTELNNASLLHLKTYNYDLSLFEKLYLHFNQDIKKMISYCKSLEKSSNPHHDLKTFLSSVDPTASH